MIPELASYLHLIQDLRGQVGELVSGLPVEARGRIVPVRWAILHVIDHTALHLGHMQITYQLWMGGQRGPSPRWYERLT